VAVDSLDNTEQAVATLRVDDVIHLEASCLPVATSAVPCTEHSGRTGASSGGNGPRDVLVIEGAAMSAGYPVRSSMEQPSPRCSIAEINRTSFSTRGMSDSEAENPEDSVDRPGWQALVEAGELPGPNCGIHRLYPGWKPSSALSS